MGIIEYLPQRIYLEHHNIAQYSINQQAFVSK